MIINSTQTRQLLNLHLFFVLLIGSFTLASAQSPMKWVSGAAAPTTATIGGNENGQPLYVCRARYEGGLHPGKIVTGNCNIGWGGKEIVLPTYEILTGTGTWGTPSADFSGAFVGGQEARNPLFLCRAKFNGGLHPGKLIADPKTNTGTLCNIGWGGDEQTLRTFELFYPTVRSIHSSNAVKVHIKNATSVSQEIYWVDYSGQLKLYGTIASGQQVVMETYESHPWILRQGGRDYARYRATADKVQFLGIGTTPQTTPIEAGPLWHQQDAQAKCPRVCDARSGIWTSAWWTTEQGRMSVCECKGFLSAIK